MVHGTDLRCVVLDDDAPQRLLLRLMLIDGGMREELIGEAGSLDELREVLEREPADVVFVDFRLGAVDGLEVAGELLESDPDAAIVMLTGAPSPALEDAAELAGITMLLNKDELNPGLLARTARFAAARRADRLALRTSERELAGSAQRQRLLLRNLPGSIVALYDAELKLTHVDGTGRETLGATIDTLIGQPLSAFFPGEQYEQVEPIVRDALEGRGGSFWHRSTSGREYEVDVAPFKDESGTITGALSVWHDVTAHSQERRARERAEARFRQVFVDSAVGMAIATMSGKLLEVNQALADLTGRPTEELNSLTLADLTFTDDRAKVADLLRSLTSGTVDRTLEDRRWMHADGHLMWVAVRTSLLRSSNDEPDLLLAQCVDITPRRQLEQQLREIADHDPLTGLVNRRGLERTLSEHIALVGRYGATGALLALDLDHFKDVNDNYGHEAGDELLRAIANGLRSRLRVSDMVARLGGDEFAVLLPRADGPAAMFVGDSLRTTVGQVVADFGARAATVSVSIGVTTFRPGDEATEALARADAALYEAKRAGRNRVVPAR